jgi:hypothetical protein
MTMMQTTNPLRRLLAVLGLAGALSASRAFAHEAEPIEYSPVGIPYGWGIELDSHEETEIAADHVGAWSWDEDGFPDTARGWTHTSSWVKFDLTEPAALTLTLESLAGVPWPSAEDPARRAGTNLYPSFTLYRGWDTDAGATTNADGTTLDQDHTFNNRGNIAWAEDVTYLDHLDNSTAHTASRTWFLPAGHYTINLGGNSPATIAEGRQGFKATFATVPAPVAITNASLTTYEFDPVGIPYGLGLTMDDHASATTAPDHVGAWSWDEDGFPDTARGWTHTSTWVKLRLLHAARFTLLLESRAGVAWPSPEDPARLAGTNLFPSFTLYRGWDTDAGATTNADGTTLDQDHTFNNRGNIAWAEDVTYLDHLDNSTAPTASRTWVLPAGEYTINLGGNSPVTVAEGRQGYRATFDTSPAVSLVSGSATINYSKAAWDTLAAGFGKPPVLTLDGFFDQAAVDSLTAEAILTNARPGSSYVDQLYAMNGPVVHNQPGRTTQPTTFTWVPGDTTNHSGSIGLGGIARFGLFGGVAGSLLFGDFTLQHDKGRVALGGTGWYLKGNIPPVVAVYDLLDVTVAETATSLTISGRLGVSFEVANFLYNTPADTLKDVGDFTFTGHTVPLTTPVIRGVSRSGGNLVVQGTNGVPGTRCVLVSSADLAAPASSWKSAGTGSFDAAGACSFTIPLDTAEPTRFFRLRQP